MRTVVWAVADTGNCPARDFFNNLEERERAKAQALFDLMAERLLCTNQEKFRQLRGPIWELKTTNSRFLCFFDSKNRLVVANAFKKQRRKAPATELEQAAQIHKAYDP